MVFHSPLEKKIIVKAWGEGSLFKWFYVGIVFSIRGRKITKAQVEVGYELINMSKQSSCDDH
jgi:hypothetical protein